MSSARTIWMLIATVSAVVLPAAAQRDTLYRDADGPNANWLDNPLPVSITRRTVTSATRLRIVMAPGGGQAVRIRPAR